MAKYEERQLLAMMTKALSLGMTFIRACCSIAACYLNWILISLWNQSGFDWQWLKVIEWGLCWGLLVAFLSSSAGTVAVGMFCLEYLEQSVQRETSSADDPLNSNTESELQARHQIRSNSSPSQSAFSCYFLLRQECNTSSNQKKLFPTLGRITHTFFPYIKNCCTVGIIQWW